MLASLGFIERGLNVCVQASPDSGKTYLGKRNESCVWIRRTHPFFTHFLRLKQLAAT